MRFQLYFGLSGCAAIFPTSRSKLDFGCRLRVFQRFRPHDGVKTHLKVSNWLGKIYPTYPQGRNVYVSAIQGSSWYYGRQVGYTGRTQATCQHWHMKFWTLKA